jgi:hypothetical protein
MTDKPPPWKDVEACFEMVKKHIGRLRWMATLDHDYPVNDPAALAMMSDEVVGKEFQRRQVEAIKTAEQDNNFTLLNDLLSRLDVYRGASLSAKARQLLAHRSPRKGKGGRPKETTTQRRMRTPSYDVAKIANDIWFILSTEYGDPSDNNRYPAGLNKKIKGRAADFAIRLLGSSVKPEEVLDKMRGHGYPDRIF